MSKNTIQNFITRPIVRNFVIKHNSFNNIRLFSTNNSISSSTPEEKLISEKLKNSLNPSYLNVMDISGGCGSMFAIEVTSKKFNDLNIVKQHKLINQILKEDIPKWHGLQLKTKKDLS
ncbi:Bol3p SCDLUD_003345 [Saccharomycodes ludwigii]|uniref:Bol3p n=1 Tax=Saccharomycodes ludwigii TaxID=36035 RepID=UPI001E8C54F6|nr:hypothetical protein SCDLUD_003345 [Saccharomycodes ludwigii]KAH3900370.1 hypothetical protein SCDLUD_003345 [Saccharomycodes ludwigii]